MQGKDQLTYSTCMSCTEVYQSMALAIEQMHCSVELVNVLSHHLKPGGDCESV